MKIIIKTVEEIEYKIKWKHIYINIVDDEYVEETLNDLKLCENPNWVYEYEVKEFENDFLICTNIVK